MTLTSLLAVLDGGKADEAFLKQALALGGGRDLLVQFLHVRPGRAQTVPLVADGLSGGAIGEIIESLEAQAKSQAEACQALYQKHCVEAGLPLAGKGESDTPPGFEVAFEIQEGLEEEIVARRGRRFDLVAVAQPTAAEDRIYAPALEAALFRSGRPVLVLPAEPAASLGKRVAVAWTDCAEAARALEAALPFLEKAEAVQIFSVSEGEAKPDPESLKPWLARHGVKAETKVLEPDYRPVGEQLLDEAAAMEADLFVMGGYGHSRLRELVLGGATRKVLELARLPLFLAH